MPKRCWINSKNICLGNHEIHILDLTDKMQKMHTECETIPQYIEALEEAQAQVKRVEIPITNKTLAIYATKAMLSSGRYPKVDDLWEDLDKADLIWAKWKVLYTKADRKAVVKRIAAGNVEQFGDASTGGYAIDRTNRK